MKKVHKFWIWIKNKGNTTITRRAKNKAKSLLKYWSTDWINSLAISSSLSASASTCDPLPCSSSVQQLSAWLAWWITVCCRFISLARIYTHIQRVTFTVLFTGNSKLWACISGIANIVSEPSSSVWCWTDWSLVVPLLCEKHPLFSRSPVWYWVSQSPSLWWICMHQCWYTKEKYTYYNAI